MEGDDVDQGRAVARQIERRRTAEAIADGRDQLLVSTIGDWRSLVQSGLGAGQEEGPILHVFARFGAGGLRRIRPHPFAVNVGDKGGP